MHIRDLTNINEVEGKTASFAFGRMNPPTIGHKKLADAVLAQAGDPYIFLSQSQKPQTDPLDFVTKLALARKFFPGVSVGDPSVKTIIQALTKLDSLGYDNVIYVAGSDRIQDFTELLNQYNGKADKQGNIAYTFKDIQVVSAGERDPDAEGAEGMSASKMRAAAAKGDFEAFKSGTPEPKLAQTMYDAVRKGMKLTEKITKRTPMGDVVKDFYKSDAPQFKGKSKAKKRQMAIAAKLSKMDENVNLEDRMAKVIETLQDLHSAKPLDEATTQYILKQVSVIKEHLNNITEGKRIPRKKGQKAGSKKHSDLYTDENPKGTIQGLKFATVKDAEASVSKIRNSGKKHAHKIQAAIAMEQRAKAAGKKSAAAVYRSYINSMKKKTKKMSEDALNEKCWDGYKQVGMKKKGKRKVPNCVPESDTTEGKSPHKKGTEKYRKHMAAMHASAEPKGTMIEGISYADPQFDVEWEEANRYPYLEKLGS